MLSFFRWRVNQNDISLLLPAQELSFLVRRERISDRMRLLQTLVPGCAKEFMTLPTGASSFKEAMNMGVKVYHNLKSIIKKKYGQDATKVGDEGGFAPNIQENKEGLELLKTAIEKAGYTGKVFIGMDVAASEFYDEKDQTYDLKFKEQNNDGSQKISGNSLKELYKSFVSEYPIVSIEDPFDQDDWTHYAKMTEEIGEPV